MELTKQEKLFIDRAAYHVSRGQSIEQAFQSVLDDDIRILNTVAPWPNDKRRDSKRAVLVSVLSNSVYDAMKGGDIRG